MSACAMVNFFVGAIDRRNFFDGAPENVLIHLRNVDCAGTETSLVDCQFDVVGSTSGICNHNEDAGVICIPTNSSLLPGKLVFQFGS